MHQTTTAHRFRPAHTLTVVVALALSLVLGCALALLPGTGSGAAHGVGLGRMVEFNGWPVGTFQLASGQHLYCIEPGAVAPASEQPGSSVVDELRGYSIFTRTSAGWAGIVSTSPISGEPLRRINYVLANYGETRSADVAVAVQFAIWLLRDAPGEAAWLNHHIAWVERHGGAAHILHARELVAEAIDRAHPPAPPAAPALRLEQSGLAAEGVLAYPVGTTEVRIEGATFDGGARVVSVADGLAGEVRWRAALHSQGWQRAQEVRATGSWTLPSRGWPAELQLFPSPVPEEQSLTWAVGPVEEEHAGEMVPASLMLDAQFHPHLSTQVPNRWLPRESSGFSDTVTVGVAAGSPAWAQRDSGGVGLEFLPVIADGVVYGPFNRPQQVSAVPPVGAPIAGYARIVADRGPGDYRATTAGTPTESGYYYWVWNIREADQSAAVRATELLPAGYEFADQFGLVAEGQVVPTALRWSTELLQQEIAHDRLELRDRVTVTLHHGAWLRDETGARIPARIRLSVYQSATAPARQAEPPAGAQEIARGMLDVAVLGRPVETDVMSLPEGTRGWVTVRSCLVAEDQPEAWRGYVEEWCDDYGVPSETARIVEPEALATTGGAATEWLLVGGSGILLAGGALLLASRIRRRH